MAYCLFFHGLTGTPAELEPLAGVLRDQGHSVDLPQLPGHDGSVAELRRVQTKDYIALAEKEFDRVTGSERGPLVVGGISFGGLLALHVAAAYPALVRGVVLLSCPFSLRNRRHEFLLRLFSYLPERLLDRLPMVKKDEQAAQRLDLPRVSYPVHAVGAAARLVKVRRMVLAEAKAVRAPLLLLQDPLDHHVQPLSKEKLATIFSQPEMILIKDGAHLLTLGPKRQEVCVRVLQFLNRM
jgi:carboxylesterase